MGKVDMTYEYVSMLQTLPISVKLKGFAEASKKARIPPWPIIVNHVASGDPFIFQFTLLLKIDIKLNFLNFFMQLLQMKI